MKRMMTKIMDRPKIHRKEVEIMCTFRNVVWKFLVPFLIFLFAQKFALSNDLRVFLDSENLKSDRILITDREISDLIASTKAELEANAKNESSNLDAAKIELLQSKMSNLVLLREMLQIAIPNFYNQHFMMWQKLFIARNVLHVVRRRKVDRYLVPPYTWIVQAGNRFIGDWDANSIAKHILDIVFFNKTYQQRLNMHDIKLGLRKPLRNLYSFLNSLPWKAFLVYLEVTLRMPPYIALRDKSFLPQADKECLKKFLDQVSSILASISHELIELMPRRDRDPLLTKIINDEIRFSDEHRLAAKIDFVKQFATENFNRMDESLNWNTKISFDSINPRFDIISKALKVKPLQLLLMSSSTVVMISSLIYYIGKYIYKGFEYFRKYMANQLESIFEDSFSANFTRNATTAKASRFREIPDFFVRRNHSEISHKAVVDRRDGSGGNSASQDATSSSSSLHMAIIIVLMIVTICIIATAAVAFYWFRVKKRFLNNQTTNKKIQKIKKSKSINRPTNIDQQ